jgi:hypothetical protein
MGLGFKPRGAAYLDGLYVRWAASGVIGAGSRRAALLYIMSITEGNPAEEERRLGKCLLREPAQGCLLREWPGDVLDDNPVHNLGPRQPGARLLRGPYQHSIS